MKLGFNKRKINEILNELGSIGFFNKVDLNKSRTLNPIVDLPTSITLQLTNRCNLKCKYCYYSKNLIIKYEDMTFEIIKKTINLFVEPNENKEINITFFGGEPLLKYNLIKETIEYIEKYIKNKKIHYFISTNGTLFNNEIYKYLSEKNVSIQISIDGIKEKHDRMRLFPSNIGSYDIIFNNISKIKNINKSSVNLKARVTLFKNNTNIKEIFDHLCDIGFKKISFAPVTYDDESIKLSKDEWKEIIKSYKRIINDENYKKYLNLFIRQLLAIHNHILSIFPCGAGKNLIAISPNGDIYPCHRFINIKEFIISNVYDGIDNEKRNEFLKLGYIENKVNCKNCWIKYLCAGGCYYDAYFYNKKINSSPPDEICYFYKQFAKIYIYLYNKLRENE
ncbi:MAG: SPASM domain-containing protein, partial [Caldisericia bacterium]|nr:SPASM domain-containing protein [Caldisericia bacterium]